MKTFLAEGVTDFTAYSVGYWTSEMGMSTSDSLFLSLLVGMIMGGKMGDWASGSNKSTADLLDNVDDYADNREVRNLLENAGSADNKDVRNLFENDDDYTSNKNTRELLEDVDDYANNQSLKGISSDKQYLLNQDILNNIKERIAHSPKSNNKPLFELTYSKDEINKVILSGLELKIDEDVIEDLIYIASSTSSS